MMILIVYLVIVNVVAFALMGIDKRKAIKNKYRIPEKVLFMSAILLGSIGANLGMQVFRHKTKHMSFVIGMPIIFLAQVAIFMFIGMRMI
ncbi:MAG: DUF1294 domain-containing protein [Lachnospiraceae bacterium]|nr:DUF1294 domain-containing protein [Lachnospiraceae bacterium]